MKDVSIQDINVKSQIEISGVETGAANLDISHDEFV